MNMKDVKAIKIPNNDYEQLEYIDIPAACYISLYDNGSSTVGCYIDAILNLNGDSISSSEYPFGSMYYNGSTYYRYHLIAADSGGITAAYASSGYTNVMSANAATSRHVVELNYHEYGDLKVYCDNVQKGTFSPTAGTTTGYLRIGARMFNNNGTITYNDYAHTMRLYALKVRVSSAKESIFYPVKRKSDGKIGLFKVYNFGDATRFCTTETSTEPIAGPVITNSIALEVKKIEDANGNIIWGSQSAFPYRRLEYIHFSGAEAVNCWYQFLSGTTYKRVDMRCKYLVNNNWGGNGYYSSSNNKMLLGVNGSGKTQFAVGSRYVYNTSDLISIDTTKFYDWVLWSNNGSCDLSIYNGPGETDLVGKSNSYSYTFNANAGRFYAGAYNNNGTLSGYSTMDLQYIKLRASSYSNLVFNGIPCQRKSDGVCGLYDTVSGVFRAMEGTTITDAAAGPVVDEYWNLQE